MSRERIEQLEAEYLEENPESAGTVEPFVYDSPDDTGNISHIPLTSEKLLSKNWEETEKVWFVDSSGFGTSGEAALTVEQFQEELQSYVREHPDHGFGISGVGQFQVYVSAYKLRRPDNEKRPETNQD